MKAELAIIIGKKRLNMSFQSEVSKRSVIRRSKEIAEVFLKYGIPIETLFPGIRKKPKIGSSNVPLNKRLRLLFKNLVLHS